AVEILLGDPTLPAATRARVERIARATQDMRIVMDGLLALAREPDRVAGSHDLCDAAELVQEVVEQHRPLTQGRPIALELDIAARPTVRAQRALMAVAVGNLLRNALAYTPDGKVTVRVEEDRL